MGGEFRESGSTEVQTVKLVMVNVITNILIETIKYIYDYPLPTAKNAKSRLHATRSGVSFLLPRIFNASVDIFNSEIGRLAYASENWTDDPDKWHKLCVSNIGTIRLWINKMRTWSDDAG